MLYNFILLIKLFIKVWLEYLVALYIKTEGVV
jgi:hypothetical protein